MKEQFNKELPIKTENNKVLVIEYGKQFSLPNNLNFEKIPQVEKSPKDFDIYLDSEAITDTISLKIGREKSFDKGDIEIGIINNDLLDKDLEIAKKGDYFLLPSLYLKPEEDDELFNPLAIINIDDTNYFSNLTYFGQIYDDILNLFTTINWADENNNPKQVGFFKEDFKNISLIIYKKDPRDY